MIDVLDEDLISLRDAAAIVPAGKVHIATIHRWIKPGLQGINLESMMVGGRRFTSKEALVRFFEQVTKVNSQKREELAEEE